MAEFKPIHKEAIPAALERAMRYRLLNEPLEAESICLDVLEVDSENQQALITLLLALTDQFEVRLGAAFQEALAILPRLEEDYSKVYYEGIICERRAKAHLARGGPISGHMAFEWLHRAMELYEKAETIGHPENDEAILRWNTCARLLQRRPDISPDPTEPVEQMLE